MKTQKKTDPSPRSAKSFKIIVEGIRGYNGKPPPHLVVNPPPPPPRPPAPPKR